MKRSKSTAPTMPRAAAPKPGRERIPLSLRSWAAIADFLETLPGCEKDPPGGREVVRVAGKVLSYLAINDRSKPPDAPRNDEFVILRIDFETRAQLLESHPDSFFVTPHYQGYPGVIIRLSSVDQTLLRNLLIASWRLVAPKRLLRDWDSQLATPRKI